MNKSHKAESAKHTQDRIPEPLPLSSQDIKSPEHAPERSPHVAGKLPPQTPQAAPHEARRLAEPPVHIGEDGTARALAVPLTMEGSPVADPQQADPRRLSAMKRDALVESNEPVVSHKGEPPLFVDGEGVARRADGRTPEQVERGDTPPQRLPVLSVPAGT